MKEIQTLLLVKRVSLVATLVRCQTLCALGEWNPMSQFPLSEITHEQGVITWLLFSPGVSL